MVRIVKRVEGILGFTLWIDLYVDRRWAGRTTISRHGSLHYLPLDYYEATRW